MVNLKRRIPEEVETVYQFIDVEGYRVVKGLEIEEIEISGKMVPCRRLITVHAGTKDEVIKRFLDHDTDRPVSNSSGVGKPVTKSAEGESTEHTKPVTKRGRPKTAYPIEKIMKFNSDGMTTRDIQKVTGVSHMTVSRIIAGQKSLI